MKRTISLLLSAIIIITSILLCVPAMAAESTSYSINGGVLTISGSGAMNDYEYAKAPWYPNKSSVTKIIVKNGITAIGKMAFADFGKVTTVELANSVISIGEAAFYKCSSLSSFTQTSSVRTLNTAAFYGCSALTSLDTSGIEALGDYAFQDCRVTEFNIAPALKNISWLAFFKSSIKTFTGGNSKYVIKNGTVFTDGGDTLYMVPPKTDIKTYSVPYGTKTIGNAAFANTGITSVSIPDTVTKLGSSAFQNTKLKSITIPDSVTEVEDFTFYECTDMESVTFGKGLKTTSYQMFQKCYSLKNIDFGGLEVLGAQTFSYCNSLTEITIPATIKEMEVGVFGECRYLKSFTSTSLKIIPYQTFWNCIRLENVNTANVESISRCAFFNCPSIKEYTAPASIEFIHTDAFPATTAITCLNPQLSKYGENGYRMLSSVNINVNKKYSLANEVLALVNKERKANGLSALVMNSSLMETAMERAGETAILFSHTRPDSSICMSANKLMTAENIALGQRSPEEVMNSWMNSEGHRANILSNTEKTIGIGCIYHNGVYYWVQCFGQGDDASNCSIPADVKTTQTVRFATEGFTEAPNTNGIIFGIPTEYSINPYIRADKTTLKIGESIKLQLCVENAGAPGFEAIINTDSKQWSASSDVITLNGEYITANKAGKAEINARADGYTAKLTVTVKDSKKASNKVRKPAATSILKLTKKKKAFTVKWRAVKNITAYQIQYSTSKSFKKTKTVTVKADKTLRTVKKLKKKKTYYVRIRSYKIVNGKKYYSNWSSAKKVKTK